VFQKRDAFDKRAHEAHDCVTVFPDRLAPRHYRRRWINQFFLSIEQDAEALALRLYVSRVGQVGSIHHPRVQRLKPLGSVANG
jgi:hypothetical protein